MKSTGAWTERAANPDPARHSGSAADLPRAPRSTPWRATRTRARPSQTFVRPLHTADLAVRRSPSIRPKPSTIAAGVSGGPVTVQRVPLTDAEKAVDLESTQLRDDDRLQRAFDNSPPMQIGESGPPVAKIQQALLDCGFVLPRSTKGGAPDGVFGDETLRVVKGFQTQQGVEPDGIVGRQTLGELDGRLTGKKPPGSGPSGPTPPATAVSVSPVDVVPLTLKDCGEFIRKFNWTTNGRNGYLIQEVRSSRSRQDCTGADLGDDTIANQYWESWRVREDGDVLPRFGGVNDTWARPASEGRGSWSLTGDVFFVEQLDPAAGFSPLSGTEAGQLNATKTKPSNLGKRVFTHSVGGRWDCCGAVKTHVPSTASEPGADNKQPAESEATNEQAPETPRAPAR